MAHLTSEQRYTIGQLLKAKKSQQYIADIIGKDKSVVCREIKRNSMHNGIYKSEKAQSYYLFNRQKSRRKSKWTSILKEQIIKTLKEDKSPEQVVGIRKKNKQDTVSIESIYTFIWHDKKKGGTLYTHLRNGAKRYRKRGNYKDNRGVVKDKVMIAERPEIVAKKERIGDIEIDLVIGANHQHALLTIVERSTGFAWIRKLESKNATMVSTQIIDALRPHKHWIKTITSDNGKEFANHKIIATALEIDYYFANPYHSWERGCNENYNRLVRQYFPKKSDFTIITKQQVQEVENKLNERERKRLDFESPINYIYKKLLTTKVAFAA